MSRRDDDIEGEIVDENGAVAAAPSYEPPPEEVEYDIIINETSWDEHFTTLNIEFEVPNAPKMPWSKTKSVHLRTNVEVVHRTEPSKRLGAGKSGGAALVFRPAPMNTGDIGTHSVTDSPVPKMPDDEVIVAACRKELQRHLDMVEREVARAKVMDDAQDTYKGRTFKVKA